MTNHQDPNLQAISPRLLVKLAMSPTTSSAIQGIEYMSIEITSELREFLELLGTKDLTTADPPLLHVWPILGPFHGPITTLAIYIPFKTVYLIDIEGLTNDAFITPHFHDRSGNYQTLQTVLESADIPKVFFDVSESAKVLQEHHDIKLAGAMDLQIMEKAARDPSEQVAGLRDLGTCVQLDSPLPGAIKRRWRQFQKEGGNYLDVRRMALDDGAGLVAMPYLWAAYAAKIKRKSVGDWKASIKSKTATEVVFAQQNR